MYQPNKARGNPWAYVVDVAPPGAPRKQVRKSGFRSQKDAQEALNELLVSLSRGTFAEPNRITFGEYLEQWLESMFATGYRPSTCESYEATARRHLLIDPIAHVRLQELSRLHLNQVYERLLTSGRADGEGGLSNRSVRYVHGIVHKALADAVRDGLVARNEATFARPPSPKSAKPPEAARWTGDELRRFLTAVADGPLYVLWRLYAMTGMRRAEGIGLRATDIDFHNRRIHIRQIVVSVRGRLSLGPPKTEESLRTIDLDEATLCCLEAQLQDQQQRSRTPGFQDHGLVFSNADGTPMRPNRVAALFQRAVAGVDVPRITLHGLRHTHATLLIDAGVNIKVVQERLGHADAAFTLAKYTRVVPGAQAKASRKFVEYVGDAMAVHDAPEGEDDGT